jgi:hypothetical protein
MDRKQLVVQRARDLFGDRLDDVIPMIRQDRQDLRGWEEPAQIRAVLRRTIREAGDAETEAADLAVGELDFGRTAGEPDRGQQRETLGQILETGANALEKIRRATNPDLTPEERMGLECALLLYARPALLVSDGHLASVPAFWNLLEDQREDIEMAQRGAGRIELLGHPELDWAGTGFLVSETCLMTTRQTLNLFAEPRNGGYAFRPGITAWMSYNSRYQQAGNAGFRIKGAIGVLEQYDLALLEVEPPQQRNGAGPTPLAVAPQAPPRLEGRPAYVIGYPIRDGRRNEPEIITRIFRDVYNVKRVQPGLVRGTLQFGTTQLLQTDCAPLGLTGGSPILDLETHQVLGLQLSGRYLETGTAVPLWTLRDEPLFRRAGVTFAEATVEDLQCATNQIERLARSRYWSEARATISSLYQRAFENPGNTGSNGGAGR